MYSWIPYILIFVLLMFVIVHSYLSLRYGYDWIGNTVRKMTVNKRDVSITDLYPIPQVPYMDRFGQYTKIPKMKENTY